MSVRTCQSAPGGAGRNIGGRIVRCRNMDSIRSHGCAAGVA